MTEPLFEINAQGVDVDRLVRSIREAVEEKRQRGLYADGRIARAERFNLVNLRKEEDFLPLYLDCLRDAVVVDIADYEILERRRAFTRLLVAFKRVVWKLLKFYTYRLWSQQNQVNGLLLAAVESADAHYRDRLSRLEARVAQLEQRPVDPPPAPQ